MGIEAYSTTPALNVSVNGINIAELCPAGNLNDAQRQVMADIKTWYDFANPKLTTLPTFPLSIANGGTGQTTASAARDALLALDVAFRKLPQTGKNVAFSFAADMSAGYVYYTGAAAAGTIDPNSTTAIDRDTVINVINKGSGALTITRGAGVVMIWAQTGADANRTLAVGGWAVLLKVATDTWIISGAGLS